MTSEVKAYLPPKDGVTIYHLKELASGEKKYVKCDAVKHLSAPHFEGLTVDDFLEYTEKYPQIERYLPPPKEIIKLPR